MISQETKDQIKRAALVEFPERLIGTHTGSVYDQNEHDRAIWKEGATKYTEKLEDKDKEIEKLTEDSCLWKIAHDNCANHFDDLKKRLESKDLELTQLKEIAERMAKVIETWNKGGNYDAPNAFTAYAEWCKQNLK